MVVRRSPCWLLARSAKFETAGCVPGRVKTCCVVITMYHRCEVVWRGVASWDGPSLSHLMTLEGNRTSSGDRAAAGFRAAL